MIVKLNTMLLNVGALFESSVNSYDSQTDVYSISGSIGFESSVNSYDSQTLFPLSVLLY